MIEFYAILVLSLGGWPVVRTFYPSLPPSTSMVVAANVAIAATVLCWTAGLYPLLRAIKTESRGWMGVSVAIQVASLGLFFVSGVYAVRLLNLVFTDPEVNLACK